jgi:hypothetical protein
MKRPVVVVLVLVAAALAASALALAGCGDAGAADADTSPDPTVAVSSDPDSDSPASTVSTVTAPANTTATSGTSLPTEGGREDTREPKLRITRYEEDHAGLSWIGVWTSAGSARDSGGTCRYTANTGSSVTVEFTGVSLVFITRTARDLGKVQITVDGGPPVTVDCYSPLPDFQEVLWATDALEPGPHTVKIQCAGIANAASIGTGIYIDAFVVAETPGQGPVETPEEEEEQAPDESDEAQQ